MTVAIISLAALGLLLGGVIAFLATRVVSLSADKTDEAVGRDKAETAQHLAEAERDDALTKGSKAAGDLVIALKAVRALQATLTSVRDAADAEKKKVLDASTGPALVDLVRGVFAPGDVPGGGDAPAAGGAAGPPAVPPAA